MASTGDSLGEQFETRPNALNAIRLVLASVVIVWHATLLDPDTTPPWPVWQLLEEFAVDAFFAISGFLITRSWLLRPNVGQYALARAARLLPGLWVCLAVTAFALAPLAGSVAFADQVRYLLGNAGVFVTVDTIPGLGIHGEELNVSLWSLWWETLAYVAVAALGVLGVLRVRVLAGLAGFFWVVLLALTLTGQWPYIFGTSWLSAIPRLGLMFTCGALLYLLGQRVPMRGWLAGLSVLLILAGAFTPNYQLLAAPAVAYLMLWFGLALGQVERLRLRTDLSYGVYVYGYPVQQALILAGLGGLGWVAFSAVSIAMTLPVAAVSWFAVERPVQELVKRLRHRVERAGSLPRRVLRREPGVAEDAIAQVDVVQAS